MPGKSRISHKKKTLSTKQRKEVRQLVRRNLLKNSELKYYDDTVNLNMTNQWTWRQIFLPTVGTSDAGERIGDTVMPRHMEIRMNIVGSDVTNVCRVVFFRVKTGQSANTYFALGSSAASAYAVYSPYSKDRRDAIDVLYDRTFTTQTGGNNSHLVVKNLRLARKKIQFIGGATTYEIGGLYMAFCSDSGAASHPTIIHNIRTFYTDS